MQLGTSLQKSCLQIRSRQATSCGLHKAIYFPLYFFPLGNPFKSWSVIWTTLYFISLFTDFCMWLLKTKIVFLYYLSPLFKKNKNWFYFSHVRLIYLPKGKRRKGLALNCMPQCYKARRRRYKLFDFFLIFFSLLFCQKDNRGLWNPISLTCWN